jgi:cytoskeleton protein RodZ
MSGENAASRTLNGDKGVGSSPEASLELFTQPELSAGQQLQAARKAKGLSVDEIARALKISHRQVEALEADDWPSLPGKTIIRGFVRNYARLLNLNSDLLMSALDGMQMPIAPELEMAVGTPVNISHDGKADRRDYVRVLSGLIILALAVLAYFVVPQDMWKSTLSALRAATQSNEPAVDKGIEPVAVDTRAPDAGASTQATTSLPSFPPALEPVPTPLAPAASGTLKFSFAKPAWVEVRDRSGQIIFSQLSQADSQRDIEGQPPFTLVVGNAAHVALQYNGKSVDLSKRSKDDVARLTLE